MAMRWDEGLAVGEEEIDRQHRVLFSELPPLREALQRGGGPEDVRRLLDFWEKYAARHFHLEERLHAAWGYPDPERLLHKLDHAKIRRQLVALEKLLAAEGATLRFVMLLCDVTDEWLKRHADEMDRAFARFVRARTSGRGG